jgi:flagellar biosynthesis/type III secretory pathway chaperone
MRAAPPHDSGLVAVLDEQLHCARAMLETLAQEHEALRTGDPERLNAAGADKARLVETLEALERERRDLAAALEIKLASVDGSDAGSKWRQLLEIIEECKRRNQLNGGIVRARREQVLVALKLLRGTEVELYDASGAEHASRGARTLGSA